jgi:hypothetical protein
MSELTMPRCEWRGRRDRGAATFGDTRYVAHRCEAAPSEVVDDDGARWEFCSRHARTYRRRMERQQRRGA